MFNRPNDIRYVRFLRQLHASVLFDWYMEIGCRSGKTFAPVRGRTIAVDPYFQVDTNVIGPKPALHVFQQTSDAFFASGFLSAAKIKPGFSFLDGMHLFEYLLRDFMNTEKHSHPDGVIALHDCCPFTHDMTTREIDPRPTGAWTGDVWKIIPILQQMRPDLKITVLGCKPTGLVLVSNLNPKSRVLSSNYDALLRDWTQVTLEDYGTERFFGSFDFVPCAEIASDGFAIFDKVRLSEDSALTPTYVTP